MGKKRVKVQYTGQGKYRFRKEGNAIKVSPGDTFFVDSIDQIPESFRHLFLVISGASKRTKRRASDGVSVKAKELKAVEIGGGWTVVNTEGRPIVDKVLTYDEALSIIEEDTNGIDGTD